MRNWCLYGLLMLAFSWMLPSVYGQDMGKEGQLKLGKDALQEEQEDTRQAVVSASRSEQFIEDLPVTVYVITREEILKNGYTTLVDALKSVPGIKVSQPGSGINGETFLMRGLFGNYYTKILIDNVEIQPSVVSGMPIAEQLPIRQAERIEVIFGPASAMYGADAMGGVINIVTKKSDRPVFAQADLALGSQGFDYLNISIGGKVGKGKNVMEYSLFGNSANHNDMNVKYNIPELYNPSLYDTSYTFLSAPNFKGDSSTALLGDLPQTSRLIGFGLKWRGLSFMFHNMTRRTHSSIGQSTAFYRYYDASNFWKESIWRGALSYEKSWAKVSSVTSLTYLVHRLHNQSNFGLIYDGGVQGKGYKYAASDDIVVEETVTWAPMKRLELIGGLYMKLSGNLPVTNDLAEPFETKNYSAFDDEIPVSDSVLGDFGYNPIRFGQLAAYLQLNYTIGNFSVLLSTRYDYQSIYKGFVSPRLALLYHLSDIITLRGSWGRAFRAPSTYYSYNSQAWQVQSGGIYYDVVPNPDLKPESIDAFELGLRFDPNDRIHIDLVGFYHILHDQFTLSAYPLDTNLYPNPANNQMMTMAYVNYGDTQANLFGLQLNVGFDDIVEAVKLDVDLNVSYNQGKEVLPYGFGTLNNYRGTPKFMGQLNFSLVPWKKIYLNFRNVLMGDAYRSYLPAPKDVLDDIGYPTETKAYYTLDMTVQFNISRNFDAFFILNNVFNAKYGGIDAYGNKYDLVYNPQYGRNFRFGLSFNLE